MQSLLFSLYRQLERPKAATYCIALLLMIHSGLLAYSAYVHSPTLNEPAHLVAGISHWKFDRYELYRVNPPLVRMVAALPVMAVGYEEDWSEFSERRGARPVFRMGRNFVSANKERSYFLFMIARWACIPFSWLGAIICYLWAKDLFGKPSGIVACMLWCFSPNILAHASLITPDAHATALGLAACYTFWKWLKKPTWTQAALTGCVLGLAELTKTTMVLFFPLWPLLWIAYRWPDRKKMRLADWAREAGMLTLRMAIGLLVLNSGYNFEGSGKLLKDFEFVSGLLTSIEASDLNQVVGDSRGSIASNISNRFSQHWLGSIPTPLPENYVVGIDIQQRDFERPQIPSYLGGEFRDHGWWYFYLYALVVKVPLGTWALIFTILILGQLRKFKSKTLLRDRMILLGPPLVIFLVVSYKSEFTHHMRYVLPCFPFAFIWIGQIAEKLLAMPTSFECDKSSPKLFAFRSSVSFLLLFCSVFSCLSVYPHNLSYFNKLAGGPLGGSRHLLYSNLDWGQDLRHLKCWIEERGDEVEGQPFHLAYSGGVLPSDLGIHEAVPWPNLENAGSFPTPGFYAIGVNLLQGSRSKYSHIRQVRFLKFLREQNPYGRAGFSIFIYQIDSKHAIELKQILSREPNN